MASDREAKSLNEVCAEIAAFEPLTALPVIQQRFHHAKRLIAALAAPPSAQDEKCKRCYGTGYIPSETCTDCVDCQDKCPVCVGSGKSLPPPPAGAPK